jgi:hypothetical protein
LQKEADMKKLVLKSAVVLAALSVGIGGVWYYFWNQYNPVYHNKRLYIWVDQAIWDEESTARQEAVQVLLEALPTLHGEPRTQLLIRFPNPIKDGKMKYPLPREVLPFLIEAVRVGEGASESYAGMALFMNGGDDAISALEKAFEIESDADAKKRMKRILDLKVIKVEEADPARLR